MRKSSNNIDTPKRCLVVEDEPLAQARAQDFIGKLANLQWVGTVDNAADALVFLKNHAVDIVFLDINLGTTTGIELLERSQIEAQVIFTTAYHEHALRAFDLQAADYLLKPYTFERFVQAVDRALGLLPLLVSTPVGERAFIFVKTEYRLERIQVDDLRYVEGMGDYLRLHTHDKKVMTLLTFAELENMLPADRFCRVHKSYLVALGHIESVERDRIRIGDALIPVSDGYKKGFYGVL